MFESVLDCSIETVLSNSISGVRNVFCNFSRYASGACSAAREVRGIPRNGTPAGSAGCSSWSCSRYCFLCAVAWCFPQPSRRETLRHVIVARFSQASRLLNGRLECGFKPGRVEGIITASTLGILKFAPRKRTQISRARN